MLLSLPIVNPRSPKDHSIRHQILFAPEPPSLFPGCRAPSSPAPARLVNDLISICSAVTLPLPATAFNVRARCAFTQCDNVAPLLPDCAMLRPRSDQTLQASPLLA